MSKCVMCELGHTIPSPCLLTYPSMKIQHGNLHIMDARGYTTIVKISHCPKCGKRVAPKSFGSRSDLIITYDEYKEAPAHD